MDAKLSLTTKCNARCATCPVWKYHGEDMPLEKFFDLWRMLNESDYVTRILLNNTGDLYNHPDHVEILKIVEANKRKHVIMTTNAGLMDYVPAIDVLIISFNGGTKEAYERTTGLDFDDVQANIRLHYDELRKIPVLEMHCLIWDGNEGTENALLETWRDFPGRIRVSYKYDNQMEEDHTLQGYRIAERIPCDYLGMISILPNGDVVSCAHDFEGKNKFGNVFDLGVSGVVENNKRTSMMRDHLHGNFSGICEKCNYNTPIGNRIKYLK